MNDSAAKYPISGNTVFTHSNQLLILLLLDSTVCYPYYGMVCSCVMYLVDA